MLFAASFAALSPAQMGREQYWPHILAHSLWGGPKGRIGLRMVARRRMGHIKGMLLAALPPLQLASPGVFPYLSHTVMDIK